MEYLMKMEDFAPDSYYAETAGDSDVVLRFTSAEFAHQSYDEEDIYNFKLGPITLTLKKVSSRAVWQSNALASEA